jgi:hypothetical protein
MLTGQKIFLCIAARILGANFTVEFSLVFSDAKTGGGFKIFSEFSIKPRKNKTRPWQTAKTA